MAGLLDFLQAASNSAASNVAGPVDLLAWGLRKAGVPVGDAPVMGSEWLKRQGLMRDVQQSPASLAGETFGLLAPIGAAAKAPQIAAGLLSAQDLAKQGAKAVGTTAADMTADYMARQGLLQPATVWHGSPHKFDKFSSQNIGTGEGAQAYGHGLYFADAKDVAMTYQPRDPKLEQKIMQRYSAAERMQQYPAMQVYEDFLLHKTPDEVASNIAAAGYSPSDLKAAQDALKVATKEYHNQRAGALYKVDLPDSAIAKMLDWDKPLSQQAPEVQKALAPFLQQRETELRQLWKAFPEDDIKRELARMQKDTGAGQAIYEQAGYKTATGDSGASEYLRSLGIPGIRYLDGGSRGAGQGTSNYVVFPGNEGLLSILERNGVPVK